jgi:RimJ/RimL family protein N-acetyltransferase
MMDYRPKEMALKDGEKVLVRAMGEDDFEKSFSFFSELPEEDRLFLRTDVSNKEVVARRLSAEGWDKEVCYNLIAEKEDRIIADARLCRPKHGWTSHTASLRYVVARDFQHKGLGTILARELFVIAVKQGIKKIETEIMEDNTAAIKSVEKLGFLREGTLKDFVTDIHGRKHNLVIMSYFV